VPIDSKVTVIERPEADSDTETSDLGETARRLIHLIRRRRWWILVTTVTVSLATVAVLLSLPNRYRSEATLVVVQQQISQRYVEPALVRTAMDAVAAVKAEIFSRTKLLRIIDEFGLFGKVRTTLPPERLAELMLKQIEIDFRDLASPRPDSNSFTISFTADNPRLAADVTARLAALFVEAHLRAQETQAATTTTFLTDRLAIAKKRLTEHDQRIQEFKTGNLDALPAQEQGALNSATESRFSLQNTMANLTRIQQQLISLEASLSGILARQESEKGILLSHFTSRHPNVLKKEEDIEKSRLLLAYLKNTAADRGGLGDLLFEDPVLAPLKVQVEAAVAESRTLAAEEKRLRTEMLQYQRRLKAAPLKEQQLAELMRDYDLYKQEYTDLLSKQLRSQMTASLEERQESQHFRLVDPPTVPSLPNSPKRLVGSIGGLGAGLALGLALAFFVDTRKGSYYYTAAIRKDVACPIVLGIPLLSTAAEQRRARMILFLEWIAASVLVCAVLAAELYVYSLGRS
jgi:polysaccharide chain length determinant protein (PEP-CTERM system associated)